jgi:ABC-type transport system substrate-binding protein
VENAEANQFAQVYQADLAKIGVTLNIKVLEPVVWSDQVSNKKYNGGYIATSTRANLLPGTMLSSSRLSDPVLNNSGFSDDTYTKLVADAGLEPDPVKAKQIYSQINDVLLDQSFAVFLTPAPPTMIVTSAVHGVSTESFGGFGYTDAWIGS